MITHELSETDLKATDNFPYGSRNIAFSMAIRLWIQEDFIRLLISRDVSHISLSLVSERPALSVQLLDWVAHLLKA